MTIKKMLAFAALVVVIASCKSKTAADGFVVKGKLTNHQAKMIYLEEMPMTTMQRTVVDSAIIGKSDAKIYNLVLDLQYPLAAIINDVPSLTLNANFNPQNTQFADSYDVKGSPSSTQLKDFITAFNNKLAFLVTTTQRADSLSKQKGNDSLVNNLENSLVQNGVEIKNLTDASLKNSKNPALSMFILGYYQSMANNPAYRLEPMDKLAVTSVVDEAAKKFPDNKGVAAIKESLQGWIGKTAPEFTLPDPTGKNISLSSFRGKYVLVDFWASWCKPCRMENPTVVKAFNRFKDKNFTVLGVSLDQPGGKDAWTKAIMEDKLTWQHVSDLKYWQSPIVPMYKIEGIPFNVLVDPAGKIIADNLRGELLEEKLAEVLK
jgi:thiol-disulfide isomerase/thioredoxin